MNLPELDRALRTLRLSGMADVLDARLRHAQAERLLPLDFLAMLVSDELQRRQDRLLERRRAHVRIPINSARPSESMRPAIPDQFGQGSGSRRWLQCGS
jgi:hypothetical protein